MEQYDAYADIYDDWNAVKTGNPYGIIEMHRFFDVLGPVRGLDILDLATGSGRTARMMMAAGARSVVATDISEEMLKLAIDANAPDSEGPSYPGLRYEVLDGRDETFQLDQPVDVVIAWYLLPYATCEDDIGRMGRLIARNLKPGGRFVTHTTNPDYDFSHREPRLLQQFGFDLRGVDEHHGKFVVGELEVDNWIWSRDAYEMQLGQAGLTDIQWHDVTVPADDPELAAAVQWYLDYPHSIVLSAAKESR